MSRYNFENLCPLCCARDSENGICYCYICKYIYTDVPEELEQRALVEAKEYTIEWFNRFFEKTHSSYNKDFEILNAIVKEQFFYKFPVGTVLTKVRVLPTLVAFIEFGNNVYEFTMRLNNRYDGKRTKR